MVKVLCSQLRADSIPVDYDPVGEYWQCIADARHTFTNYETLLERFPDCPVDCPIAASNGDRAGAACSNYEFAQYVLKTEAKRLAKSTYDAWHAQRHAAPAARAV